MKNRILALAFSVAAIAAPALAQTVSTSSISTSSASTAPLPPPPPVEKELAAKASNVTEVTLGKNMLGFAAKFMNGKNGDEAATRQLIEGLDGIYVRDYEFDKEGEYSMVEVDKLRQYFETGDWTPLVRSREKKSGETTDVMVKMVNGESHGMFILSAEPKELSIVLILGPIRMDQLGKLGGLGGLGSLGNVPGAIKEKDKKGDGQ